MSVDFKLIGMRIKAARKSKGKTQEWLAEQLDVSVGYISQLERGITKISLETLSETGAVLETDMAYFLTGVTAGQGDYLKNEMLEKFDLLSERDRNLINDIIDSMIKYK